VLVVDDEKSVRRILTATLNSNGYETIEAADGEEALAKAVSGQPDAIILDLSLPDKDGLEVLGEIRKRSRIPVLIVSVRDEIQDKLVALDAGADDYLAKPFDPAEILARLRAIMRRLVPAEKQSVYRVRDLTIDVTKHSVELNGKPVPLTPKEFDILKMLVLSGGAVLTHARIVSEIWGKEDMSMKDAHTVRVTIKNLRDKIERHPGKPEYILSILGVGYRLIES
jgi:two-component system KDP operon response regulator KdpE